MPPTPQSKEFAFSRLGSLWIGLHTKNSPHEHEWQAYLEEVKKTSGPIRLLGFSDGGGPSGARRKEFGEAIKGRNCNVALITTSGMVYAIATAVQFLVPSTKVFRPRDFAAAYAFHNMTKAEITFAETEANRLAQALSEPLASTAFLSSPAKV